MSNTSIKTAFTRLWYHITNKFATKESVNNKAEQTIIRDWTINSVSLITFTVGCSYNSIDPVTFQAEEGMTWREWCETDYNTEGFYCESETATDVWAWNYQIWDSVNQTYNVADIQIIDGQAYEASP